MQKIENDNININLVSLFKVLWKEKLSFLLVVLFFIVIAIWYSFTVQEQFISEGKILPELQTKGKVGDLAGLASLAGIDLGNIDATEAIRPDLYPDVLQSTPFFLALFKEKIITKENKQILFEQFYHQMIDKEREIEKKNSEKFPVKEEGFLLLNNITENRIRDLKERIQVSIDKKSGIISISAKMPDPVAAACVTRFSMTYLTKYITKYRTDKAEKDLNRERIEADYRISSTFYGELQKKYEEAKIKVQQETPVFQILEPPNAPTQNSEPRKFIILILSVFLGGLVGAIIVLIKKKNYKQIIEI